MTDDQQEQQTTRPGGPDQRRIRWGALLALIVWTIILYVANAELPQQVLNANIALYNHSGAVRNHGYALTVALGFLGFITYIGPVIVGALARTWRGALAFALIPLWLAMLPTAAITFAGFVPGSLVYGNGPVQLAPTVSPAWLNATSALAFVLSSAVFAILSTIGWAARYAWTHELRTSR